MSGAKAAPPTPAPDGVIVAAPVSKPAADQGPGGRSLWEKTGDNAPDNAKPKRQLKRKTTEEIVEKSLYDNFKTFTASEIDGVVVEGMTLRQRLHHDKAAQKTDPKGIITGQRYYAMLKDQYASTEHATKRLVVKDQTLSVAPALMKAMVLLQNKSQNNRGAIVGWMSTATTVNQKEPKTLRESFPT